MSIDLRPFKALLASLPADVERMRGEADRERGKHRRGKDT